MPRGQRFDLASLAKQARSERMAILPGGLVLSPRRHGDDGDHNPNRNAKAQQADRANDQQLE